MRDRSRILHDLNKLAREQRASVIRCLCDGVSIRATGRITGAAKNTIQKLTRELGPEVMQYQDVMLRNLPCKWLELDEVWCFCYAKDKNLPDSMRGQHRKYAFSAFATEKRIRAPEVVRGN